MIKSKIEDYEYRCCKRGHKSDVIRNDVTLHDVIQS